jgi:hypothetical protein
MRKRTKILIGAAVLTVLLGAGTAEALRIRAGDLLVIGDGGFRPTKLPKHHDAPITIYGGGRIDTVSGNPPPIIKEINFEFDRHGSVQTKGLPVCTRGRLEATTVAGARHMCPGAIVGKGNGSALVTFPEQAPFKVSSPITVFNGPRKHGNPTVFAHAYTTVPVPTTFVVPIEIERIHKGVYGYRTQARIPRIANGYGIPISGNLTIGRRWTYKGVRHSYVNARCETGRLQARGLFVFTTVTLRGTFFKPCQVRGG